MVFFVIFHSLSALTARSYDFGFANQCFLPNFERSDWILIWVLSARPTILICDVLKNPFGSPTDSSSGYSLRWYVHGWGFDPPSLPNPTKMTKKYPFGKWINENFGSSIQPEVYSWTDLFDRFNWLIWSFWNIYRACPAYCGENGKGWKLDFHKMNWMPQWVWMVWF